MTSPTISDYLKYANLQMAAEAFLATDNGTLHGTPLPTGFIKQALIDGNLHASLFPSSEATSFASQWEVVDQCPNTKTGFSATLFRCKLTDPAKGLVEGQYVVSFRSTEFIDDAIRDSAATNTLEIKNTGFAWGQLSDMEAWYASIKADPAKLGNNAFSVTGYSLGGHLATAFNLLHCHDTLADGSSAIRQVVTFNGAGIGEVKQGSLGDVLAYFNDLRGNSDLLKQQLFTTPELAALYDQIKTDLNFTVGTTTAQAKALTETAIARVNNLSFDSITHTATEIDLLAKEKLPLLTALNDMLDMQKEALRVAALTAGNGDSGTPQAVLPGDILAESLDYRLAVGLAAKRTESASLAAGVVQAVTGKSYGGNLPNQFDMVGTETTTISKAAVANSQWHYGTNVPVFIEDQPLYRGDMLAQSVFASLDYLDLKLLVDQYNRNNFADTHSLVLIVDSLAVQNVLQELAPTANGNAWRIAA